MDKSTEEQHRFIAAQNGKSAANDGKRLDSPPFFSSAQVGEGLDVFEKDYEEPTFVVNGFHHEARRKRLKLCLIFAVVVIFVIAVAAAVIVLLFGIGSPKARNFRRTSLNFSMPIDNFDSNTTSNSTQKKMRAEGRPYWSPCAGVDTISTVQAVFTKDCITAPGHSDRCLVKKGSEGLLQIHFTPQRDVEKVHASSCGWVGIFCVAQEMNQPNACIGSNLECPLRAGKPYIFRALESVRVNLPGGGLEFNVDTQVKLEDETTGNIIFCVIIPIRVSL